MYSNLNLYYLMQMGITPWVNKNDPVPSIDLSKKSTSLLVVTPKLTSKEQHLLNNVCSFLGVPNDKLIHHETDDIQYLTERYNASFSLLFGFDQEQTPIKVRAESLSNLLANPLAKKKLFNDLLLLKEQLATS